MRLRFAAAALAVLLSLAEPAAAADPIMPLSEVRSGMQCTGLSVVQGTEISSFSVEVLDVVDGEPTAGGPRILVRASGPAVDDTGIGPGFSGSPILCPGADGAPRNIGAISEGLGEFGGKVVLATPIEAVLGNPVDPPVARRGGGRAADRRILARARPLTAPLTISGLSPALGARLQQAAAQRGRVVLAAPAGPLGSFPPQELRPGAALGVSYASGDVRLGAVGTVAYTDGASVWGFGHFFEGLGRRSLFLQDAYVYRVVPNPVAIPGSADTYKLAATGHDLGTLTNDAPDAVVGRVGALPVRIPVRVRATDLDRDVTRTVSSDVADETAVDQPSGTSAISLIAPLAVLEASAAVLRGAPARLTGKACVEIGVRRLADPMRFCKRYVTEATDLTAGGDPVASLLASDVLAAISYIDAYRLGPVHVTGISARLSTARGERLTYLRGVRLPERVRAGSRVRATLLLRHVRGPAERRRVTLRLPADLEPGPRRLHLTGTGPDFGVDFLGDLLGIFGEDPTGAGPGMPSLQRVAKAVERIGGYDGLRIRGGAAPGGEGRRAGRPAYRAPDVRIAGRASTRVRVVG